LILSPVLILIFDTPNYPPNESVIKGKTLGKRLEKAGEGRGLRALHVSPGESSPLLFCVQVKGKKIGFWRVATSPRPHPGIRDAGMGRGDIPL